MAQSEVDPFAQAYFSAEALGWAGGFLHSNNVFYYFQGSPFYDGQADNTDVINKYRGTEFDMPILGNRLKFEEQLRSYRGTQYVVAYDPRMNRVDVDGPNGKVPSELWIIRKQQRHSSDQDDVTPLEYYYIINNTIFRAPTLEAILRNRMLNTITSLNKVFNTSGGLSYFSPSQGHTYFQPVQKSAAQSSIEIGGGSKEQTPVPGMQSSMPNQKVKSDLSTDQSSRTLAEALQMTLRYGHEYMDEVPLVGEPGSFRFDKVRDSRLQAQVGQPKQSTAATSQLPSAAPSPRPVVQGPGEAKSPVEKSGVRNPHMSEDVIKPKRRKSRVANQSP